MQEGEETRILSAETKVSSEETKISAEETETLAVETKALSKRAQKKLEKRKAWLEKKGERRAQEKAKRKAKVEKRKAEEPDLPSYSSSRKQAKKSYEEKVKSDIHIAFDMGLGDKMNQRDRGKCLKQLLNCYSINRRLKLPLNLHLTKFDGILKQDLTERYQGHENWDMKFHADSHATCFQDKTKVVYLSSESENVIQDFEPGKIYVIGALVDHNLHKGLCHKLAIEDGIEHARLPIDEYVSLKTRKVLAINHVFQIIGKVASEKSSWADAFLSILPKRKGAIERTEESE